MPHALRPLWGLGRCGSDALIFLIGGLKAWMRFDFRSRHEVHAVSVRIVRLEMLVAIFPVPLDDTQVAIHIGFMRADVSTHAGPVLGKQAAVPPIALST